MFWRNYFFHCAYTRYEAGLSIDEIWSDYQPSSLTTTTTTTSDNATTTTGVLHNNNNDGDHDQDEVVHFSSTPEPSIADAFAATAGDVGGDDDIDDTVHDIHTDEHRETDSPQSDYEIVQSAQDLDDDEDAFDGEMDELEAEIAQALGD